MLGSNRKNSHSIIILNDFEKDAFQQYFQKVEFDLEPIELPNDAPEFSKERVLYNYRTNSNFFY